VSARSPRLLLPFVVVTYTGLLAPLVVVIAVSFGPSAAFEFPPRGLTLHWFEAFFASQAFVAAFFRVSLLVGLLSAALATLLGTSAALGLVRFRFFGREAVETLFSRRFSSRRSCLARRCICFTRAWRSRHRSGPCFGAIW
jgi:ABC-type spermidine/putrescine transport system permease subunit II